MNPETISKKVRGDQKEKGTEKHSTGKGFGKSQSLYLRVLVRCLPLYTVFSFAWGTCCCQIITACTCYCRSPITVCYTQAGLVMLPTFDVEWEEVKGSGAVPGVVRSMLCV